MRIGVVGIAGGWSSERLCDTVRRKTGWSTLIDMEKTGFDVSAGKVTQGELDLAGLDALIVKKIGTRYSPDLQERLQVLRYLKRRGLRIFSDPDSIAMALDRLSCTTILRLGNIPLPPTTVTEDIDVAEETVRRYERAVFKPIYTSKARGMKVIRDGNGVRDEIQQFREAGHHVMYMQKMLDLPGRDLGLVFLGGEYIGTYARVSNGESWNTTTRSGGRYEIHKPGDEIIELARRAQALFDLDFTSVDVAETDQGPVVFEVSAFGGFRGLMEAAEVDAAELYVDYVVKELSK